MYVAYGTSAHMSRAKANDIDRIEVIGLASILLTKELTQKEAVIIISNYCLNLHNLLSVSNDKSLKGSLIIQWGGGKSLGSNMTKTTGRHS